jgi:hypothetical protein
VNRRSFITRTPAGAAGLAGLGSLLDAQQTSPASEVSRDVMDFWINRVGVPSDLILPKGSRGARIASEVGYRASDQSYAGTYGNEPLFLYVEERESRVIPAQEIRPDSLLPSGDAILEMQMGRLRLNPADQSRFEDLSSGGLYVDVQQNPSATPDSPLNLGWSLLGAVLPKRFIKPGAGGAAAPQPAAPAAGMLQSVSLPGGAGRTMFNLFLKNQKRSAFGSFLSAFTEIGITATNSFLPMLQLPGLSAPALMAIRALVGKLQGMGGNQHWLFQTSPVDIACTMEAAATADSIRFRPGTYIVLPKAHAALLKDHRNNVKVLDGFLVPKEASALDVYDAAPSTASGVSYLSMRVNVKKIRLNGCLAAAPLRG